MAEKRLLKEYGQLVRAPASLENSQILELGPVDTDNVFEWAAVIRKANKQESSFYYNGQWRLEISVGRRYPVEPPKVQFSRTTPIFHPNINMETGEICLDILKLDSWSAAWNLQSLVGAILILIDDPEPDSPLNIDLANLFRHDKVAFESMVQYYIWKYNVFEVGEEPLRHPSGIKVVEGVSLENEHGSDNTGEAMNKIAEEEALENAQDCSKELEFDSDDHTSLEDNSQNKLHVIESLKDQLKLDKSLGRSRSKRSPNLKVIQDVGQEVTRQFLDKVNEIGHSSSSSQGLLDDNGSHLEGVKQQVADNVTKQVERLCLKSASPDSATFRYEIPVERDTTGAKDSDEDIEKVRQEFMKQVDHKIKLHEENVRKLLPEYQSSDTSSLPNIAKVGSFDLNKPSPVQVQHTPSQNNVNFDTTTEPQSSDPSSQKSSVQPSSSLSFTSNGGPTHISTVSSKSSSNTAFEEHGESKDDSSFQEITSTSSKSSKSSSSVSRLRRSLSRKDKLKNNLSDSNDKTDVTKRKFLNILKLKKGDKTTH